MVLNVEWKGKFPLKEAQVKYNFPEITKGIYRLLNAQEGGYGVFYVGQTDNLQRRLLEHLSNEEKNNCIKKKLKYTVYFRFAVLDDETDRLCAESFLYKEYDIDGNGPTCNEQEPQVKPCEINLN